MIAELDGRSASDAELESLYLVEAESDPVDVGEPRTLEEAVASYRNPGTAIRRRWLVTTNDDVAGAAALFRYGDALVIGTVLVRPAFRRRGFGRALFDTVVAAAREDGVASFFGEHATAEGAAFARAVGAVDDQQHVISVLDLHAAELPPPAVPAGIELRSWTGRTPDELLESFVRARNAMADAPVPGGLGMPLWTPEEQRRDEERWLVREVPQHVTVALEGGEVVALTAVRVPNARGVSLAHTDDTTTVPAARGRGLARAVKLENLRRLRRERPDVERIGTKNATHNAAMLAVNGRLGFVPAVTLTTAVVRL